MDKRGELNTSMFEFCKQTKEENEEYKVFFQKNRSEFFKAIKQTLYK